MRPNMLAGVVVLVLGLFLVFRGGTFKEKHDVLKVGDLKITATEEKSIPDWVGWVALVGGVALLLSGTRKKA